MSVKRCLEDKGLRVIGGPGEPSPGDTDAPDRGELITAGAFIAFYSSEARADELAEGVRDNAERLEASVERRVAATIVYMERGSQDEIDACLDP